MSQSNSPPSKIPTVTVELSLTYPAKADMTADDFLAEINKAKDLKAKALELMPGAKLEGKGKIGKQAFKL